MKHLGFLLSFVVLVFAEAAASAAVRSKFASFAMEPIKMSGPEYEMFLRAELPRMRPALEAVGLAKPKS